MEYKTNNPVKYDNWIMLLKELYEKNVKKYEEKENNLYYSPMRWKNGQGNRQDAKKILLQRYCFAGKCRRGSKSGNDKGVHNFGKI